MSDIYEGIRKSKLYKSILDPQNIYNAIFALESYVFEKGLLENDDLELYYSLGDKYDIKTIKSKIEECQERLKKILSSPEELFEVRVFFKIKKYDDGTGKIKYRPMHTAGLIDQICMVCLLQPLMFDDCSGERKYSDLSKLIPHNFYGNIPSTDVGQLFKRWQDQYKKYTEDALDKRRRYQQNHRYNAEITLDIKNFFPSVNPAFIYNYIIEKLSTALQTEEDKSCLNVIVSKLLYFRVKKENIRPWSEVYYGNEVEGEDFMVRGIPQGLPQSYLFGNLCMIEVSKKMTEQFDGDAYFYVDDSVIYVTSSLDKDPVDKQLEDFKMRLAKLNKSLEQHFGQPLENTIGEDILSTEFLEFQERLNNDLECYKISFHESEKSEFRLLDDNKDPLGGEENLARVPSKMGEIFNTFDEVDDAVSYEKLSSYLKVVENQLKQLRDIQSKQQIKGDGIPQSDRCAAQMKRMKRFKRYFLFRKLIFEIRLKGELTDEMIGNFKKDFQIEGVIEDKSGWFDRFEEDIFSSECRIIIEMQPNKSAKNFQEKICSFEKKLTEVTAGQMPYLYFCKDTAATLKIKELSSDPYRSLIKWVRANYKENRNLSQTKQVNQLIRFINEKGCDYLLHGFGSARFTRFVFRNSQEFKRKIVNTYFSEMIGVKSSDALSFVKDNSRHLCYTELRLLARLRNRRFNCKEFLSFTQSIDPHDLSNRMAIDMGILTVLNLFIRKVQNPNWVDALILTHRVVKGLWYNGSKFLNSYTLHNEEHAVTLINKSVRIIKTIDYLCIKNIDYYILFLSCYLHDISMVIHPDLYGLCGTNEASMSIISDFIDQLQNEYKRFNAIDITDNKSTRLKDTGKFMIDMFQRIFVYFENSVRSSHPFDSAKYIRESANRFFKYIDPSILSFVAKVSESHGYDAADVYGLKSEAKNDLISLKYMMIVIRLADLLDLANDRVNYHLLRENIPHMGEISKFHWISHLITDEIQLTAKYPVADRLLNQKPITEILTFDLYLNVRYMFALKRGTPCRMCFIDRTSKTKPAEEYKKSDCIVLKIGEPPSDCEPKDKCPFMCRWVLKKHGWLINELFELKKYLFSVNNTMISTEIKVNIFFRDEYKLDADLIDSVKDFLENS